MLSKKHRLTKSAEVKRTAIRGRSFFNPLFVVKSSPGTPDPRITVIVSTKVSKKAVVRNRIKRIIRDVFRLHIAEIKPGNYAIIVKPKAADAPASELRKSVETSLAAARILL